MKVKLKAGRCGYPQKTELGFPPIFDAVRHRRLIIEGAALFQPERAAAQKENRGSREDESKFLARMGKILAGGGAGLQGEQNGLQLIFLRIGDQPKDEMCIRDRFNIINILFIWDILLYTIPIWAICNGLIKLAGVFALMRRGEGGFGWKLLTGFFGILLGALLLILPAAGIMTCLLYTSRCV